MTDKLVRMPIMEIFGPTIQGEGMVAGRKTMFIRTGGCDYSCAWCDSAFTWNGEEKATMMDAEEVFQKLLELGMVCVGHDENGQEVYERNFDHVTISGGNPALIGSAMEQFIKLCQTHEIGVGLETQGSRWQDWFFAIDDLTISPKPPSSKMVTDLNKLSSIVQKLRDHNTMLNRPYNFSLKVVVFDDADFDYAKEIHRLYPDVPFFLSVGNEDPKEPGDISGRILKKLGWLWDKVLADPQMNDVRVLPQLHTLVWANRRAV